MVVDLKLKNMSLTLKIFKKIKNWPTYILDSFNLINKEYITYKMNSGLKYFVRANTTDKGIITTVDVQDEYGLDSLALPKDAIIIDIGAQAGIFSVYASRKASKIFAYEPILDNYNLISKNIIINQLVDKIIPFNLAVSDKKEKLRIFLSKNHTAGHSIYGSGDNYIDVQTTTLKDIFDKNKIKKCDLLKIDVEGSEYRILYSLPDRYFSKICRIHMEYHDVDNDKKNHRYLIEFLKSKGFKVKCKRLILFAVNTGEKNEI